MRTARHSKAFTLVELLVGLLVTSIILSAVATLAFALSSATRDADESIHTQTQVRQATLRVSDLIGRCLLICAAPGDDLVVWRSDDNADNQINVNEIVYIERGQGLDILRLCQFSAASNPQKSLGDLVLAETKAQLISDYYETYTALIPECKDVGFAFDSTPPPVTHTKCVVISFTLAENGADHRYEIVATLQSRAGHLLNAAGDAIVATDDD